MNRKTKIQKNRETDKKIKQTEIQRDKETNRQREK